ncbi:MAG TPA: hypothetical protein VLK33_20485 [Terriglobales bacterium]|jgi:hypothetical protein|nr:hypothetical protein [Terriglobales bacterium]
MPKNGKDDLELYHDAWARFEWAAGAVAKAPLQHRVAKGKPLKDKPKAGKAKPAAKKPTPP